MKTQRKLWKDTVVYIIIPPSYQAAVIKRSYVVDYSNIHRY